MTTELSPRVLKVQQALQQKGLTLAIQELNDSTRTAQQAAEVVGCDVAQIVKSLIFKGKKSQHPFLVVASGGNRVSVKKLSKLVGEKISKPNADFVRAQTGFAIGGVPPVGHIQQIPCYIDDDLLTHDQLWAAAGSPNALFCLSPDDLLHITNGEVADVKE